MRFAPLSLRATSTEWWVSAPVFSAAGDLAIWTRYHVGNPDYKDLAFVERQASGCWTQPEALPSGGNPHDAHAAFQPGTDTLFIISDRPGGPLFRAERTLDGWTESVPVPISLPFKMGHQITIARNGTLYFRMTNDGNMDLYRSVLLDGQYVAPESLGPTINTADYEYGPYVSPDEDFILFASNRHGGYGKTDLYVSFRTPDGNWDHPVNLGSSINTVYPDTLPFITPDGEYLFFISRRSGDTMYNPYWVSTEVIERLRPSDG